MIHDAGVKFEYLPPYSSDFNPIEESFAELKQWNKKNRILVEDCENFEEFLRLEFERMSQFLTKDKRVKETYTQNFFHQNRRTVHLRYARR